MKLKLDDAGHVVVQDDKPVYVHDDGKEVAFDAAATVATVNRLFGEAKGHREAKEAIEKKYKGFEGIEDPEAAIKALATVKNLDDKKLVDAGEVERVKAEAIKAVEEKYKPIVDERDKLVDDLYKEKIGGSFARSKFRQEKLVEAYDAETTQAVFGHNFKIEDGKAVGYDRTGNKIFSRSRPGELADFDEALEVLAEQHPNKGILKLGNSGGGAAGGATPPAGGAAAQIAAIASPTDRITAARAAGINK